MKYDDLDITGLDGVTTKTEVNDALKKAAGLTPTDESIKIKNVRPAPNGTKRETASMRSNDAIKIIKEGHIQIGLVWAKICLRSITKRSSDVLAMDIRDSNALGQTARKSTVSALQPDTRRRTAKIRPSEHPTRT